MQGEIKINHRRGAVPKMGMGILLFLLFLNFEFSFGQQVSSSVDSTQIKIGEQLNYELTIDVDTTAIVVLPQGQTFTPLEVIDESAIDTTLLQSRYRFIKKYGLTQFDSGTYIIPRQKVIINDKVFYTDSLAVKVFDVAVDTTKQKMYDIKPIVPVEKSHSDLLKKLLWIFLILAVIGLALYWFLFRKKQLSEDEKMALLPPYDRALLELQKLEESKYLIQSEYKQYYSELTNIVRLYLEEEVHVSAMESTTDELIEKLEMLKDTGGLELDKTTITQFKQVLKTADLVKFAKSEPDTKTAERDRNKIEEVVHKTKEALPEPTEEDMLLDEVYLKTLERKKFRKQILLGGLAGILLLVVGLGVAIARYGAVPVKDTLLRHPTKMLLESEWVASEYGAPPLFIETPKVLKRIPNTLSGEWKTKIKESQQFSYTNPKRLFTVSVAAYTYAQPETDPDFKSFIQTVLSEFEKEGAKNILEKQEEFTTRSGIEGIKTYGSGVFNVSDDINSVRGKYAIVSFGGKGFVQQVVLRWPENDDYAEAIVQRILNSIDVKKEP